MRDPVSKPRSLSSQKYNYLVRDNPRQRCSERAVGTSAFGAKRTLGRPGSNDRFW